MTTPHSHRAPRLASTVIIARESADSGTLEFFIQQRQSTMAYAANAVVFPGGGVEDSDYPFMLPHRDQHMSPEHIKHHASRLHMDSETMAAHISAARREVWEETGVDLGNYNHELIPIDRWITPDIPAFRRRYDTATFVLILSKDSTNAALQHQHQTTEATHSYWATAEELLTQWSTGHLNLLLPTWWHINQLNHLHTLNQLYSFAQRTHNPQHTPPTVFANWTAPADEAAMQHYGFPDPDAYFDHATIAGKHHTLITRK
ncbi:NUDIX domain-containing protein [Corynebacterium glutamicum]|uniref:Nudix hydrolase domain-containing protein n=1 Tax=Corynebacterium glutamicum (strain ATCC 13032 / DSM 20300 / JCM 1318 / BCRC 11384 / CCUG 27702 / LMG 3730 / NBRC 12168 / NCIMB 10025 / NRRL B-2784 / 534) TaxID=196627 RepID=Q8NPP1_CORGL|nr:NUDIX domain-containing protein [Corynebacterium glutamicum]ARV64123.1 NUDIX hydrolase [Corynebacterium glutamicum]AUI01253.1 NUDIX hydrolase [Corynebacterium glutamicum]AUI04903.1 NUDIX hydrolase [Corynebacterium glutamicum]MBA4570603.1 NUDIX domain-containing protein [Corynebacterium glutamicum]MBA4573460.1 NUDIX domain-containing protein [Corynebacterium glutamicum]